MSYYQRAATAVPTLRPSFRDGFPMSLPWWRRFLAQTLDTVEPLAQRLAGGLGVDDVLLPSPHPLGLEGVWLGFLPESDLPARLALSGQGAAELWVDRDPVREGAWAVAGSRDAPRFQLELGDEPLTFPPMRAVLVVGPGERPLWWRWGPMQWVAEDVLEDRRPADPAAQVTS